MTDGPAGGFVEADAVGAPPGQDGLRKTQFRGLFQLGGTERLNTCRRGRSRCLRCRGGHGGGQRAVAPKQCVLRGGDESGRTVRPSPGEDPPPLLVVEFCGCPFRHAGFDFRTVLRHGRRSRHDRPSPLRTLPAKRAAKKMDRTASKANQVPIRTIALQRNSHNVCRGTHRRMRCAGHGHSAPAASAGNPTFCVIPEGVNPDALKPDALKPHVRQSPDSDREGRVISLIRPTRPPRAPRR